MITAPRRSTAQGTSLIEVLVTMVVLGVGLLGLVGLQSRMQTMDMESYQRAQAMILLEDMASRIAVNRNFAASYVTGSDDPLGAGMACPVASNTRQEVDFQEWCNALQGVGEVASNNRVGAMIGGRGCIELVGANEYLVTVTWQGLVPLSAPPASVACGAGLYNGNECDNDQCRRTVTTLVHISPL